MGCPARRFYETDEEFEAWRAKLCVLACPHCGQIGCLILHGYLRGYAEAGGERVQRGRRIFCSNRSSRKHGCGKTFSLLLSIFVRKFIVQAKSLYQFLINVAGGLRMNDAFRFVLPSAFSNSTPRRLWKRFVRRQSSIRTCLSRIVPPPALKAKQPAFETLAHLRAAFPSGCAVSAFQKLFQISFL